MMVFSQEWFKKYQRQLLWLVNSRFGKRLFGVRVHVVKIEPHAITWINGQHHTQIHTYDYYAHRLYTAFKPLWHLIHWWDMGIANNLNQALNFGFDTLTQYPEANPETTSVDGQVARGTTNESFATIRAGAGTEFNDTATTIFVGLQGGSTSSNYNYLSRGILAFNTTTIDTGATINSAQLSLYGYDKLNQLGSDTLEIVSASPTSNTGLASGDFTSLGNTSFASLAYASFNRSAYNAFTLNSSGRSNITKGGITRFGVRLGWDMNNSFTGVWASSQSTYFEFYSADYTGTSRDPVLVISYTPASTATYSNANPYANGKLMQNTGSGWSDVASGDLYFVTYNSAGATTVAYSSQDPSNILKAVIDNYNDNGGTITYDGTSIDLTGTTVSYTFNTNSILECVNKCLELAPTGWYWYVDPATNLLHFHQKSSTPDHKPVFRKDIIKINAEKKTDSIINTIYFRGGDTGGFTYLYNKYQDSTSVGLYGIRAIKYIDERVKVDNTAYVMSNAILQAKKDPEIRLEIWLVDSNVSGGYDIESVVVGDMLNVRNLPGSTGSSLWDVMLWDVDRWDYNISQIGTMNLLIVRKEYTPDVLKVFCSTIPPDVAKRIEDINRNLENSITADNPSAPA